MSCPTTITKLKLLLKTSKAHLSFPASKSSRLGKDILTKDDLSAEQLKALKAAKATQISQPVEPV